MAKNYRIIIGENLKKLRKELDWSQEDLADKAKINPAYYGRIERGEMNVTLDSLEKLCDALEVELPELFVSESSSSKPLTQKEVKFRLQKLLGKKQPEELQRVFKILELLFKR